jgi:hypothetical protein
MYYYAIFKPYGIHTVNKRGLRADVVHRFKSKEDRDEYVELDPLNRAALSARSKEVQKAKRVAEAHARHGYSVRWPIRI